MARLVVPSLPHHVTHRGSYRQTVFASDAERRLYLRLLGEQLAPEDCKLLGYCLMGNHVHLVLVPQVEDALARFMRRLQGTYAALVHAQQGRRGHLWHNRYYSCPLSLSHVWMTLAYVERNPVRAGLVADACAWEGSSARAHATGHDDHNLLDSGLFTAHYTPERWRRVLANGVIAEAWAERLRAATRTGRPLGDASFITHLEEQTGRTLQLGRIGRPAKELCVSSSAISR